MYFYLVLTYSVVACAAYNSTRRLAVESPMCRAGRPTTFCSQVTDATRLTRNSYMLCLAISSFGEAELPRIHSPCRQLCFTQRSTILPCEGNTRKHKVGIKLALINDGVGVVTLRSHMAREEILRSLRCQAVVAHLLALVDHFSSLGLQLLELLHGGALAGCFAITQSRGRRSSSCSRCSEVC